MAKVKFLKFVILRRSQLVGGLDKAISYPSNLINIKVNLKDLKNV
jgi:hypothetical protein